MYQQQKKDFSVYRLCVDSKSSGCLKVTQRTEFYFLPGCQSICFPCPPLSARLRCHIQSALIHWEVCVCGRFMGRRCLPRLLPLSPTARDISWTEWAVGVRGCPSCCTESGVKLGFLRRTGPLRVWCGGLQVTLLTVSRLFIRKYLMGIVQRKNFQKLHVDVFTFYTHNGGHVTVKANHLF